MPPQETRLFLASADHPTLFSKVVPSFPRLRGQDSQSPIPSQRIVQRIREAMSMERLFRNLHQTQSPEQTTQTSQWSATEGKSRMFMEECSQQAIRRRIALTLPFPTNSHSLPWVGGAFAFSRVQYDATTILAFESGEYTDDSID